MATGISYCPKCGLYLPPSDGHRCPPLWHCNRHDHGDDWTPIYAVCARAAAEKYAEKKDSDGGMCDVADEREVLVRADGSDVVECFTVWVYAAPTYEAKKKMV